MAGSAGAIRAGSAFVEIGANDSALRAGLEAAQARVQAFGQGIAVVGAGLAGLGAAVTAPLLGAAKVFADTGSELYDMSQRTGIAVEALSSLSFAAEQSGSSLGAVEVAIKKMQRTIAKADDDGKAAVATLDELGVEVQSLQGLKPDEQFRKIAAALGKIPEATKRTTAAIAVFGKQGTALVPMINDLAALEAQAESLGLVMSSTDAAAADALGDSMGALWAQVKMTTFQFGSALAPALTEFLGIATQALALVIDWIKHNKDLILTVFKVAGVVGLVGSALVIFGGAIAYLNVIGAVNVALWAAWQVAIIAWQGVVLGANVALALFNAQLAIWAGLLSVGRTAAVIWSAGVAAATAVAWLWNAALTAGAVVVSAVWAAGVAVATAASWLWNAALAAGAAVSALWNGALSAGAVLSAAWSAGVAIATVATWLWNAALAVLNAEMIVPLIAALAAAAGTVVILGAALVAVTATVWAAYQAGLALFQVLSQIPTTTGPLGAVGKVFSEWIGILNDVYRAATIKLPLAWQILQAGAALAVSQIRDLWPPLWTFIQAGFTAVWTAVSDIFVTSFEQAISKVFAEFIKFAAILSPLLGIGVKEVQKAQADLDKAAAERRKLAIAKAELDIKKAIADFGVEDSPATKKAREELKKQQDELNKLVAEGGQKPAVAGADIDTGAQKFAQIGTFSAAAASAGALAGNALLANAQEQKRALEEANRLAAEQLKALEAIAKALAGGNPLGIPIF